MEQWTEKDWKNVLNDTPTAAFYLYTPMCGTCAVASKMLEVLHELRPAFPIGKADLNYVQQIAVDFEIESVPCLLIQKDGIVTEKIYAFRSVPYLLEKIS